MTTKVYATRDIDAFPKGTDVREHGGFFIATSQHNIPGAFEIVAEVEDHIFNIRHNSATIDYNDLTDLLDWASQ